MTKMESEQESDHLLTESGTASPGPEVFVEMNNLDGNGHSVNFKPQNTVKYEKKATHKKKICLPKPDDEPQKNGQGASNRCNIEDNGSDSSYIQYEQETPVFRHRNSTSLVKATIDVPGDSLKKIRRRRRPPPGLGLKVVVFILFLMILVGVLVTWAFYKEERLATLRGQKFRFEEEERLLYLAFDDSDPIAIGTLGLNLPSWQLPKSCSDRWEEVNKLCYWWRKGASLELVYYKLDSLHCYNITWTSFSKDIEPKDCYGIGQLDWYGLSGNIRGAHHVLNKQNFSYVPLVPGGGRVLGSVLERYWLGSNGVAVITSRDDPVLLSWNSDIKDKFCLWSSFQHPFYSRLNEGKRSNLSYTMCKAGDMQSTHLAMRHFFKKAPSPKTQSLQDRIRLPLWAVGQVNLTNNTSPYETIGLELIDFVERNTTHPCGIVELDFGWEDNLGDLTFNEEELEDVMVMLQNLSSHGCQLSLPVSLFSHFMSENFNYLLRRDYFVRDAGGEATGLTKWNGDQLAYLDISNNEAVHWFFGKLRSLKSRFGISTFKFLHGESGLLPYKARFKEQFNPVVFTTTYNHLVANFTNVTVMHSAMGTQNLPIVISVIGKQVVIGNRQCLVDIIPAMLTVGILGYPYVSLDGSELWSHGAVASDLYLRWTQMSAFLPVMKIYTPPYGFTTENIQILKNWTELHIKTIVPLIESLSEEVVHGQPIIRPIWWVDPQDKVAQGIDDEFLVGNAILVAPILCEKTLKRDIYLPTGKWQDPLKHLDIDGGRWIYDYSIDLHDIPYFLARQ